MIKHKVIEILSKPKKMSLMLDDFMDVYWGVDVVLEVDSEKYESTATFESLERASKIKIGDVFMR